MPLHTSSVAPNRKRYLPNSPPEGASTLASSTENKGLPGGTLEKNSHANAGGTRDASLIPESGRSPGVGNGNPLHGQKIPWTEDPCRLQSMGLQRVKI